jgi:phage I-like protein
MPNPNREIQPKTTEDFLQQTQQVVGPAENQEGMLTPEQMEAIDRGEKVTVGQEEETEQEKESRLVEEQKKKDKESNAGEQQTEEIDPAVLDEIQRKVAAVECQTINILNKTIRRYESFHGSRGKGR